VQDISDVLDPAYAPSQPKDKLLFKEKQKYLYAVLEQELQTCTAINYDVMQPSMIMPMIKQKH
jgi:hypothetical protein